MVLRVDRVLLNEVPLLQESFEVNALLFAIPLMHHQQRIQTLNFHPPFLHGVFGLAKCRAFPKETAILRVPAIMQSVVHQHPGHALRSFVRLAM